MAQHAESNHDGPGHQLDLAMGVCLLLACGVIAYLVVSAPDLPEVTAETFVMKPPTVDVDRLKAERAAHYAETDLSGAQAELDALYVDVKRANAMQFGGGDGSAHDMQISMLHHANEFITKVGIGAYVPAGQQMYDGCAKAFEELLADVASGALASEVAATDPGEKYTPYREYCGNAYKSLLESGIVTPDGKWVDPVSGPLVFDIMNRFRWAAVLDIRQPPWKQLTPYEFELLTRWRASIRNVPPGRRVQWIVSAGKAVPSLPMKQLIGNLLLEQGDAVGALGAYEEACAEDRSDLALQRKCAYLREQVAAGSPAEHDHAHH